MLLALSGQFRYAVTEAVRHHGVMHVSHATDVSRQTLRKYLAGGQITRRTNAKLVRWASQHADVDAVRSASSAWLAAEDGLPFSGRD
jgi:hypothetical protein